MRSSILNGQYGVLNAWLLQIGATKEPVAWLAEEKGAMAAVIVTKAWLSVPLFMAFFLAGLQGVSQDQVDAARVPVAMIEGSTPQLLRAQGPDNITAQDPQRFVSRSTVTLNSAMFRR